MTSMLKNEILFSIFFSIFFRYSFDIFFDVFDVFFDIFFRLKVDSIFILFVVLTFRSFVVSM